eukprot:10749476-Heterocapsa_arctica.AAC.1
MMLSHPSNAAMLSMRNLNSAHSASRPLKLGGRATPRRSTDRAATFEGLRVHLPSRQQRCTCANIHLHLVHVRSGQTSRQRACNRSQTACNSRSRQRACSWTKTARKSRSRQRACNTPQTARSP